MANYFEFTLRSVDIDEERVLRNRGLESGGRVQKIVDSEVLRLMDPYVPLDTGALRDNGIISTEIGSGKVTYSVPYARRQYYIPMSHDGGRTEYWFEHMKNEGVRRKSLMQREGRPVQCDSGRVFKRLVK